MSHRPGQSQQRDVGAFVPHNGFRDVVSNSALESIWIHVVADETEEILSQAAQPAFRREFPQPLDRKDHVVIDIGIVVRIFQLMK